MYTDTDSLIYLLECEDVYDNMRCDIARFDTSDFPENNAYGMLRVNNKVPGLMKDENNGAIMTEFVGLRTKMYALRVTGRRRYEEDKRCEKQHCCERDKVQQSCTMFEQSERATRQSCIRSRLHEVYTVSETKLALSPYDDKIYVTFDSY